MADSIGRILQILRRDDRRKTGVLPPAGASPKLPRAKQLVKRSALVAAASAPALMLLFDFVDQPIAEVCRQLRKESIGVFFDSVETLGDSKWYIAPGFLAAIALYFSRSRLWRAPLFLALAVALSGILVSVVKIVLGRFRPTRLFNEGQYGFAFFEFDTELRSFPSGHATTVFAAATVMSMVAPSLRVLWFTIAVAISLGRVITGAHYLSDVIAGAWFGTVTALVLAVYVMPARQPLERQAA